MSDRNTLSCSLYREHVESTLKIVDVDVTTTQMTHSTIELERVTGMQHSPVVETRHVARLQSRLQSRRRLVQQASERRVRLVIRLDISLGDVEYSLVERGPCDADDAGSLRLNYDVWMSVPVTQQKRWICTKFKSSKSVHSMF